MAKPMISAVDSAIRLERLRVRAALERQALLQSMAQASRDLQPRRLLENILPRFFSGPVSGWAYQAFELLRRYPIVTSSLSAWVVRKGRRSRFLRLAGGAFVMWQVFKAWQASRRD
jgi:hypothetical protein